MSVHEIDPATGLPVGERIRPHLEVTPADLKSRLDDSNDELLLVDCREPFEWDQARIEGAVLIPLGSLEDRLDELEDDDGGREHDVVVYCHHGVRSLRAASALQAHGFANAKSMAGGIDMWSQGVDPSVPRYTK